MSTHQSADLLVEDFARERLVARGIEVDEVNGIEIADELAHDFLAMANTIVRKHYATR